MKLSERLREQSWIRFSPLWEDTFRTVELSDDVLAEIEQLEAIREAAMEVLSEINCEAEWSSVDCTCSPAVKLLRRALQVYRHLYLKKALGEQQ